MDLMDLRDLSKAGTMAPDGVTLWVPLPPILHQPIPGGCCCPWCSDDRRPGLLAAWDTLAVNLRTGERWRIHHPELHGKKPMR